MDHIKHVINGRVVFVRFFMLADLHLEGDRNASSNSDRLKKLCKEIRKTISIEEKLLFIVLGDIAHQGNILSFATAKKCLNLIRNELDGYSIRFEFVPGNHDLEGGPNPLSSFDSFTASYGCKHTYSSKAAYSSIHDGVNFIFTDSTLSRDHAAPGKLNMNAIRDEAKQGLTNVLFCHHGLIQNYGDDHDTIEDSAFVLKQLTELNISFFFHGHAHRADVTTSKEGLTEIGCGSISGDVDWIPNVYHQFSVGYIQDGSITCVQRWIDVSDGTGLFVGSQLYPEPRTFADPNTVNKIYYEPIDGYIPRHVLTYEEAGKDPWLRAFSNEPPIVLRDALLKAKRLLLLCDAGVGKSVELQNIAHALYSDYYFPFLFSLKDYTGEQIYDLLPEHYKKLSANRYVILFDGYDELTSSLRELFERNLRKFLNAYAEANIIISSRSNFCRSETSSRSRTFVGFSVFVLDGLKPQEIREYLRSQGINVDRFWHSASANKISDLLSNPFYLTWLAQIYLSEKQLPPKTELMDKLIAVSFDIDEKKFPGNLEEHYRALFLLLERVAFAMQLMQQHLFDDRSEYQDIIPDLDERNLIKQSGLLKRDGTGWSFLHNNFREYLAAKYLARLDKDAAIAIFSNGNNIRPSWVNTLGYLSGLDLNWDLLHWLTEHAPSALVKFESDRLNMEMREKVFESIFSKYENDNLFFDDSFCDESELAYFAKNKGSLLFLLERIKNPRNESSQYNAINILRYFPNLFGCDENVRDTLISCCESYPVTEKHICRLAIVTICQLQLNTPAVTKKLMEFFENSKEDYIRLGLYEYLISTGEQNEYVQFFASGISIAHEEDDNDPRIGNELFELVEGLKKMNTPESIAVVLELFSGESTPGFHDEDEVLSAVTDTAICLYQSGCLKLYDVFLEKYLQAATGWNYAFEEAAVKFFVKTDTQRFAVLSAVELFEDEPHHMSKLIDRDSTLIDFLASMYSERKLTSKVAFQNIVIWFVRDEEKYNQYTELIRQVDGTEIPKFKRPVDYQALEKQSAQEYFETLFDLRKREELFAELMSVLDDPNIRADKILDAGIKIGYHSALRRLQVAIYHYGGSLKVSEFFERINSEEYVIRSAAKILGGKVHIIPTVEQKKILENLICKQLDAKIFDDAIKYMAPGYRYKRLIPSLLSLIQYLDYPVDEDTLLQLTEVPQYFFHRENKLIKYRYLESKLSTAQIKFRLIRNIKQGCVHDMVLQDHIEYFDKKMDPALTVTALELCKTEDTDSLLRTVAWKYIFKTSGVEFLCHEVIPHADGNFLLELDSGCKEIPPDIMREAMERQYRVTPTMQLQASLITLGSSLALTDYVESTKRTKHISEEDGHPGRPTAAIKTISNPHHLPLLKELLEVVLDSEFVDCTWFGLRNSLMDAFLNCGRVMPEETIQIIESLKPSSRENEKNNRYCNYLIRKLQNIEGSSQDLPKSLQEAKQIIQRF